ncbi:MAG: methyltransferase domain-containing protein [Rhodobacteraceae bacterium]|nr:methyltransferase domain-containing protein [Paracoccaceae bacterium]
MPDREAILNGYRAVADQLVIPFEDVDSAAWLAPILDLLPDGPARVLDLGAGTGRDAAWLSRRGFDVTAVEPVAALREAGQRLHHAVGITWVDDVLPELIRFSPDAEAFDLLMSVGVWHHIPPLNRALAWSRCYDLTQPGGRLIVSLRHGPTKPDRPGFPVDTDQSIEQAKDAGFVLKRQRKAESLQIGNRATGVYWTWLVFFRPE